jgi:hypothetical protein
MNFLKAFGKAVAIGLQVIGNFGPLVKQTIPGTKDDVLLDKATDILTDVSMITQSVEATSAVLASPLSGPDKLKAASAQVEQIILSKFVLGKKIADPALFKEGVSNITDGVVKIQNSLHESNLVVSEVKK